MSGAQRKRKLPEENQSHRTDIESFTNDELDPRMLQIDRECAEISRQAVKDLKWGALSFEKNIEELPGDLLNQGVSKIQIEMIPSQSNLSYLPSSVSQELDLIRNKRAWSSIVALVVKSALEDIGFDCKRRLVSDSEIGLYLRFNPNSKAKLREYLTGELDLISDESESETESYSEDLMNHSYDITQYDLDGLSRLEL